MKKIYIKLWEYIINIVSEDDQIIKNFWLLSDIGGIPFTILDNSLHYDIAIYFHKSNSSYYQQKHPEYHFYIDSNYKSLDKLSLRDLIGQFLSQAAISKGVFPIHSAVVSNASKATILLGPGGAGKTITSIYLCKKYNYRWIANDWSAISKCDKKIIVVHGYDNVSLRLEGVEQLSTILHPQYLQHFSNRVNKANKIILSDAEILLHRDELPKAIRNLVYVEVSPDCSNNIQLLNYKEAKDRLERELTWAIKGESARLLTEGSHIILERISLQPVNGFNPMATLADFISKNLNAYIISGNLDYVASQIILLNSKEENQ